MRHIRAAVLAAALCGWAGTASAQLPEQPYVSAGDRLAVSADIAATTAPRDDTAFFNYTDYDHDALRTLRVRVLGEWRISQHYSILGELRIENRDTIDAAALYLRWRPWLDRDFDVQVGRLPPVIGAFARHAYGRDNIVIGFPLAYQYLTSLRTDAQPATPDDVLRMRGRGWRPTFPVGSQSEAGGVPLVSAFDWDTGIEAHWHHGIVDYAGAVTRGAPASPSFNESRGGAELSGRVAVAPLPGVTVAGSVARGHWVDRALLSTFPESMQRSAQSVVGVDGEYGRGRLLIRAEWLRSSFEVPLLGSAAPLTASTEFVEGRYRFHPRWQVSARVERLGFSEIQGTINGGLPTPWDAPVERIEYVLGYRAARNLEVRAGCQQNWRDGGRVRQQAYPALQVLYWF